MCRFAVWNTVNFNTCIQQYNPKTLKYGTFSSPQKFSMFSFSVILLPIPSIRGNQCPGVYQHILDWPVTSFPWMLCLAPFAQHKIFEIYPYCWVHHYFFLLSVNNILFYEHFTICLFILLMSKLVLSNYWILWITLLWKFVYISLYGSIVFL